MLIGGFGAAMTLVCAFLPLAAALLWAFFASSSAWTWGLASLAALSGALWLASWAQAAMCEEILSPSRLGVARSYRDSWGKIVPFSWVCVLAFIFVMGGLFLLVVPGVYLGICLLFAPFVCVAEGAGGMDALVKSVDYARGRWLALFGRMILLGLLAYLPSLLPIVGSFLSMLTGPFTFAGASVLYLGVRGLPRATAPWPKGKTKALIAVSAIGFLLPVWSAARLVSAAGPALRREIQYLSEHPLDPAAGQRLVSILEGGSTLDAATQTYQLLQSSGAFSAPTRSP